LDQKKSGSPAILLAPQNWSTMQPRFCAAIFFHFLYFIK
jgi:hypothetical protein